MGQSTDAILCWGIVLTEDEGSEIPWEDAAELAGYDDPVDDEYLAFALCGIAKPTSDYGDNKDEHKEYWTKKREALAAYGVEVLTHCSYEYPLYMLIVSASEVRASRGYPKDILKTDLDAPEANNWQELLNEACEKLGMEPQAGGWRLCSLWG